MTDNNWEADLRRCEGNGKKWLREQSLWAIWVYRYGQRIDNNKKEISKKIHTKLYWVLYRLVETLTGISLPKECKIGPGLRIWHFGGIFINPKSEIGANCTLRQGVTLGNRKVNGPCPILEDDVELGAYAQVLGGVRLGKGSRIGAMSVVLCDVPANATAVGNPARIIITKAEN